MKLEQVNSHPLREDIYTDKNSASQDKMKKSDLVKIKRILINEFSLNKIEVKSLNEF